MTNSTEVDYHGFLNPSDGVAISFWIISIAMVAATVFFLMESMNVSGHWKTSMNVGALVTLVAAVHYFYMREFWITIHTSPILYRYIDWSITVPLQMIEFNLILTAVNPNIGAGMFWRLLVGTVVMLAFGYAGEANFVWPWLGFVIGMAGWGFILFEIFMGEAGSMAKGNAVNRHVQTSFATMRLIVTVGWSIYPLGYVFGYLLGSVNDSVLNLVYNLADFVNKIAFCLAIWSCAKSSTTGHEAWERFENICQSASNSPAVEAARKLISNYERVVTDATNQSPITQPQLKRVSSAGAEYVEQLLREVARRLLGLPSVEGATRGNVKQAEAWQGCAAYFAERTQSTGQQCPGRAADMSKEAAAAFVAAVKEVASGADGGKTQTLLA
jgi:bacteriorhodopsin